jgi:hypothetical protein
MFAWMVISGLLVYLLVVVVFSSIRSRLKDDYSRPAQAALGVAGLIVSAVLFVLVLLVFNYHALGNPKAEINLFPALLILEFGWLLFGRIILLAIFKM